MSEHRLFVAPHLSIADRNGAESEQTIIFLFQFNLAIANSHSFVLYFLQVVGYASKPKKQGRPMRTVESLVSPFCSLLTENELLEAVSILLDIVMGRREEIELRHQFGEEHPAARRSGIAPPPRSRCEHCGAPEQRLYLSTTGVNVPSSVARSVNGSAPSPDCATAPQDRFGVRNTARPCTSEAAGDRTAASLLVYYTEKTDSRNIVPHVVQRCGNSFGRFLLESGSGGKVAVSGGVPSHLWRVPENCFVGCGWRRRRVSVVSSIEH